MVTKITVLLKLMHPIQDGLDLVVVKTWTVLTVAKTISTMAGTVRAAVKTILAGSAGQGRHHPALLA